MAKGNIIKNTEKKAAKAIAASKKKAKAALAAAKAKFNKTHAAIDKKIETHPDKAVLVAGALGAAIGGIAVYSLLKGKKKQ
ncbi:MAG: hypothetical protein WCW44_03820 [archaeon]|jgi:hypothetical protein